MQAVLYAAPVLEPLILAELKTHLRLDSETFAGNITTYQSILPGSHGVHELMTLDVAPGGAGWVAGDTITGASSSQTCIIVQVLTTKTYYVRNRSGAFTLGEILSNGTATADQGAANPTFATGYYLIGTGIDVLGKQAVVNLNAGTVGASGTIEAKIQESDDNATYTDWTGGAFTLVNAANDNAIQEKAYTGTKQYIRVVAKVLVAACEFGVDVIVNAATTVEDTDLEDAIKDGRETVENITRRGLLTQTWDYYLQEWPEDDFIKLPFGNLQSVSYVKWKDTDGVETSLTKSLTAFAGSDVTPLTKTKVTCAAHGFSDGDIISIDGTTSYDGSWEISNVTTNTFDITMVFVANDATGTVSEDYLVETNGEGCGRIVLPYGGTWPSSSLFPSNPIKIRFICGWTAAASIPKPIKRAVKFAAEDFYYHGDRHEVLQKVIDNLLVNYRLWEEF